MNNYICNKLDIWICIFYLDLISHIYIWKKLYGQRKKNKNHKKKSVYQKRKIKIYSDTLLFCFLKFISETLWNLTGDYMEEWYSEASRRSYLEMLCNKQTKRWIRVWWGNVITEIDVRADVSKRWWWWWLWLCDYYVLRGEV